MLRCLVRRRAAAPRGCTALANLHKNVMFLHVHDERRGIFKLQSWPRKDVPYCHCCSETLRLLVGPGNQIFAKATTIGGSIPNELRRFFSQACASSLSALCGCSFLACTTGASLMFGSVEHGSGGVGGLALDCAHAIASGSRGRLMFRSAEHGSSGVGELTRDRD